MHGAGGYTLSCAGCIAQKRFAMCEHWLALEIANVSRSCLLQMLLVKTINWTLLATARRRPFFSSFF
jgi:hypothetical protein